MLRFNLTVARISVLALFFVAMVAPVAVVHAQLNNGGGQGGFNNGGGMGGFNNGGGQGGFNNGGSQGNTQCVGLCNPLTNTSDIPTLLNNILKFVTTQIGSAIIILMLVYCGFLFVTAQGNAEKISTARTALLWTVIGAIILLGATVIEGVISATVNTL